MRSTALLSAFVFLLFGASILKIAVSAKPPPAARAPARFR
jgi:hypothetical protein